MEVNKLITEDVKKLNQLQQYCYEGLYNFIIELDQKYFNLDKTFFSVRKIKNRFILELKISTKEGSWINIDIYIKSTESIIYLDGWHENILYKGDSLSNFFEKIKKLLIFAFSEKCKMFVYYSNRKPYKWDVYGFENNGWEFYSRSQLLIYNYFGRKTKVEKHSHIFKEASYPKELFE